MELGMFTMPSHPPERQPFEAMDWDLQNLRWADEYGYSEVWIGEHFTSPWEPVPAPDLLIAQAIDQTSRVKLAPGAHLLPFHHPAELAHRVAQLDHMLQGRFMFGVGSAGLPSDWKLFNVDGFAGENRRMTAEALDLILRIWAAEEPFTHKGEFYTVSYDPEPQFNTLKAWLKPYQKPHPPIGVAGLSAPSPTLELAGERGFYPMSLNFNPAYVATHWDSVVNGAARSGLTADRKDWRIVREVMICDTDAEARRWSVDSHMGRMMREYLLPLLTDFGFISHLKGDQSMQDNEVTPEYLADSAWLVGSPDTVAEKLAEQYETLGGFGTLLLFGFDYQDDPEVWRQSMERMATEVMPKVASLVPEAVATATATG
ncbi:MAG: LLM class flavin-dependent oxidoreductase [Acidimicrobiia bacterium]|nr:LLM class flavin-dependent oxidoreductase [Acidimicrobiia bacterium]